MTAPAITAAEHQFTERALDYLRDHAIDPQVALDAGVHEDRGELVFPYVDDEGEYVRRRPWPQPGDKAKVIQPRGRSLSLWWPLGRPEPGDGVVLVCEGEGDALAAVTALRDAPPVSGFAGVAVCAIPGTSLARHLGDHLAPLEPKGAFLPFDADDAGRKATEAAVNALRDARIQPIPVRLPDGQDLADTLAAIELDQRGHRLANLLADADAAVTETEASSNGAGPQHDPGDAESAAGLAAFITKGLQLPASRAVESTYRASDHDDAPLTAVLRDCTLLRWERQRDMTIPDGLLRPVTFKLGLAGPTLTKPQARAIAAAAVRLAETFEEHDALAEYREYCAAFVIGHTEWEWSRDCSTPEGSHAAVLELRNWRLSPEAGDYRREYEVAPIVRDTSTGKRFVRTSHFRAYCRHEHDVRLDWAAFNGRLAEQGWSHWEWQAWPPDQPRAEARKAKVPVYVIPTGWEET